MAELDPVPWNPKHSDPVEACNFGCRGVRLRGSNLNRLRSRVFTMFRVSLLRFLKPWMELSGSEFWAPLS